MMSIFTRPGAALLPLAFLPQIAAAQSIDPAARGLAVQAQTSAQATTVARGSNVGMRIWGGRIANAQTVNSTGTTFEVLAGVAAPFDAIQIVSAVGQDSAGDAITPNCYFNAAVVGDPSDATVAAATPVQVTVGGTQPTGLAPAPSYDRRKWVVSDITPLASISRTDGGTLPLIVLRASCTSATSGNFMVLAQATPANAFNVWATHPSGRIWRMTSKTGQYVNSGWANMVSANSSGSNGTPIAGIIYYARGIVVKIAGFGDSITEGLGETPDQGFGFPAAVALSKNAAGITYEWSNIGWAGQTMAQIQVNTADALAAGIIPDIAVMPSGSPNSVSSTIPTTGSNSPTGQRGQLALMLAQLNAKRVTPIIWTWLPSNSTGTATKAYGATDILRRNYNDEVRAYASRGMVIADFDSALAGSLDANGQMQFKPGLTIDGIHPNDAGNAVLWPILQRAIGQVSQPAPGKKIGANVTRESWLSLPRAA